ncbi:MAG: hypothetical protein FJ189_13765 [Gammaproteobacteria bacterium]|nr:hypothetical protein [Gammaproteobacteria bacterium]
MAGMLTLVISFLARLVGLGNVARAVTNIINRVRQPIDRALDRVVTWIVATARRLGRLVAGVARGTVAAVIGWWRARKSFRDRSGQAHSLYFTGSGRTARLMMASEPRSIEDVLNDTSLQITNRDALRASLVAINRKIQERGENLGTPAQQEAFQREIDRDITALAQALSQYLQHDEALPVSVVTWGANGSRAGSVHAEPLTRNPGNTTGTSATGYREHATGFALVSRWDQPKAHTRHGGTVEVEKSRVSAAHLLHHELHGPYEAPWNIVLADQGLNNSMAPLERRAVGEKNRGVRIRYHVSVRYWNDTLPPAVAMTVEEAEVEQVQSWIGYYIARTITVAAHAFESGSYSRQIVSQSVPGNLTPVRGQVTPTLDDQIITALRQRVSGPPVVIDGQQYGNTGITSSRDIATEVVHVQYPPVNSAVQRLIAAGRLSKASPRGPFLVKL